MSTKKRNDVDVQLDDQNRPTVWDVAKLSGVSIATVSRVLNGQQMYISNDTKDRVLRAVQELKYVSPRRSKEALSDHSALIGLTFVTVESPSFAAVISGVIEALHTRNARPVVCPLPLRHNCNMTLQERFMSNTTDGGLVLGSTESDESLREAIRNEFPCVVVYPDRPVAEGIPVVTTSDISGMRLATQHLIELGHTRIGWVRCKHTTYTNRERLAGFQAALLEANLPIRQEYIYECVYTFDDADKHAGYESIQYFLSLPEPPTAVIAFNDVMASGMIRAAQERGLVVPRDLSIVGFDDAGQAAIANPELTSVRQRFVEMARIGVDMLFRLIEGRPLEATRIELSPRLMVRESTSPPGSERQGKRVRRTQVGSQGAL